MKIFLVGGAVRDELLGYESQENDWLVVNGSDEEMLALGYKKVGKDFPIYLHPKTQDEYALARVSRNDLSTPTHAVSLEDDLSRRDLTINAIAKDEEGHFIDPHGGRRDIKQRLLRHIDESSFIEDPIRVLRVARFAARYAHRGFQVAESTLQLMQKMVAQGLMQGLQSERIWKETYRALTENTPSVFIQTLRQCGALEVIFPEIKALYGVPQTEKYHPEIDTGIHLELALDRGKALGAEPAVMYAILLHDLGKGVTAKHLLPSHRGHEESGIPYVKAVNKRLGVPNKTAQLAIVVCRWHLHCHRAFELRPKTIIKLFDALGIWRQSDRLENYLLACQADSQGRAGLSEHPYPQVDYLRRCAEQAKKVDTASLLTQGYEGVALGEAIRKKRIASLFNIVKHNK